MDKIEIDKLFKKIYQECNQYQQKYNILLIQYQVSIQLQIKQMVKGVFYL